MTTHRSGRLGQSQASLVSYFFVERSATTGSTRGQLLAPIPQAVGRCCPAGAGCPRRPVHAGRRRDATMHATQLLRRLQGSMADGDYDICIIGGGIAGLAAAHPNRLAGAHFHCRYGSA
jgi:hypothetical protein